MNNDALRREVDANYDFLQRSLALLMADHKGAYALLRHCKIEGLYDRPGDAYRAGLERFDDRIFSIQQVTDEVEDLGYFSHAGG